MFRIWELKTRKEPHSNWFRWTKNRQIEFSKSFNKTNTKSYKNSSRNYLQKINCKWESHFQRKNFILKKFNRKELKPESKTISQECNFDLLCFWFFSSSSKTMNFQGNKLRDWANWCVIKIRRERNAGIKTSKR